MTADWPWRWQRLVGLLTGIAGGIVLLILVIALLSR
jgi:hypothetical protein